jgi:hypothetical protein
MKNTASFILSTTLALTPLSFAGAEGYKDTPLIPGTKWHVHDSERPQPKVVTPGEPSTAERAGTAPSDATVLFDGKDLAAWKSGDAEAKWKVENGYFEVVPGSGTLRTRDEFGPDVQLHVEFATPPAEGNGPGQG